MKRARFDDVSDGPGDAIFSQSPPPHAVHACRQGLQPFRPRDGDENGKTNQQPDLPENTKVLTEFDGGEDGIRTHDTLLTYTPLAGERLRPLGHLSGAA